MPRNVIALLGNEEGRAMVREICRENGIVFAEFEGLIEAEIDQLGKQRRVGLWHVFADILDRIQEEP